MKVYKMKEVQLGIIILGIVFFSLLFSGLQVNLSLTYGLIIIITSIFLGLSLINLLIITRLLYLNDLEILHDDNDIFLNTYKQLFFYIYFFLLTIVVGLFAEILGNNKGEDIFLVSMFTTSIYYLIVSISCTYEFICNISRNAKINISTGKDFINNEDK